MECKWTTGPWEVEQDDEGSWAVLKSGSFVTFAFPTECGAGGSAKYNAHLIAAAPDLYEALEKVILVYHDDDLGDDLFEAIKEAMPALAKARGET